MKDKKSKIGFPKEFAIYIPKMSSEEQRILKEQEKNFQIDDSLVKVRDYIIGLFPNLPTPSDFLVFALGKILFSIADYDTLTALEEEFSYQGLDLWNIRLLLRRGSSEEAIKRASETYKKEDINLDGVKYIDNDEYDQYYILHSLFKAEKEMEEFREKITEYLFEKDDFGGDNGPCYLCFNRFYCWIPWSCVRPFFSSVTS